MTRYDFPNRMLAIERATTRARRRGVPMFVFHTGPGFTISFTEPSMHRQFERVNVDGSVTKFVREGLEEATEVAEIDSRETRQTKRLTRPRR